MYTKNIAIYISFFTNPNRVCINVILQNLKLEEYSSHIPNEIIRIINKLEDNSNVYETACNCYRIINYVNNLLLSYCHTQQHTQ